MAYGINAFVIIIIVIRNIVEAVSRLNCYTFKLITATKMCVTRMTFVTNCDATNAQPSHFGIIVQTVPRQFLFVLVSFSVLFSKKWEWSDSSIIRYYELLLSVLLSFRIDLSLSLSLSLSTYGLNWLDYNTWFRIQIIGMLSIYHRATVLVFNLLTLVLLNPGMPCLCKQCRSRSVGFLRSQLIWICTVCHSVFEFVSTTWIK